MAGGIAATTLLNPRVSAAPPGPTKLDDFIEQSMRENHVAGLAACVIRKGRSPWSGGYGFANLEGRVPMTADTILNIASVSKTVTATAVMQAWEQGKFGLDENVNKYLPFAVRNPKFPETAITARQLLTHTSSVADGAAYEASYACGDPTTTLADWVREYFTAGGRFHDAGNFHGFKPGSVRRYSNVGFGLLGYLVEVATGLDFAKYCGRHIFEPLGMTRTSWYLADVDRGEHAIPYAYVAKPGGSVEVLRKDGRGRVSRDKPGHVPHCLYSFPNYPDGLLRTSVNQLARFLTAYMGGGALESQRILKTATVRQMLSTQGGESSSTGREQGLAWATLTDDDTKTTYWGHTGGDPGVSTLLAFQPEAEIGVIVFENTAESDTLTAVTKRLLRKADCLVS